MRAPSRTRIRSPHLALAVALGLGGSAIAGWAIADMDSGVLSASRASTIVVGAPPGIAPSERLDARRTGRSQHSLPSDPVEVWRRPVSGGLDLPPLVDESGNIVAVLTTPEVIKLDEDGRELWRQRIGSAGSLAAPIITSDRTIVIVSTAGRAYGLRPTDGQIAFDSVLGISGREAKVAPLALTDGSFVVASGHQVVTVSASGQVIARAELPDRVTGPPLPHADGILLLPEVGEVFSFRPPNLPRKVGDFSGLPEGGGVLVDSRTVLAVVNGRSIVALDLPTGTTQVRATTGGLWGFDGPVAVSSPGHAITSTTLGALLAFDHAGNELRRVALEPQALTTPDAGAGGLVIDAAPSPPLVLDPSGRVAFARSNGKVGIVHRDGRVAVASDRLCANPFALVPAGHKKLLVACRDGTLWMLADAP